MPRMSQAHVEPETNRSKRRLDIVGDDLTIAETLRVMDVARQMRDQRETAEEMFRRDDLRLKLREKLLRTAQISGDTVSEAEIEAAISQYFDNLHTYKDPPAGLHSGLAHLWIWRHRLLAGVVALAAAGWWFFA